MLTAAFRAAGHCAASYDIRHDGVLQDLSSAEGFLHALCLCLQVKPGALAVLAVVRVYAAEVSECMLHFGVYSMEGALCACRCALPGRP